MRKFIITGMAVAMLAAIASVRRFGRRAAQSGADRDAHGPRRVRRPDSSVHTYKVEINPCDDTFTGNDGSSRWAENEQITSGSINGSDITFHAVYPGGYSWDVASGGNGSDTEGRTFHVTTGLTTTNSTHYKNHGEFVKQSADKNDAAHSCIGMPINTSK